MLPKGKAPYTSKLKNPDRHIAKLKGEISRLQEINKDHWRRHGIFEFAYKEGSAKLSANLYEPTEHPYLLPGTDVIFKGTVTEVHRTEDGSYIRFAIKTCHRVDPRED